MPDLLISILAQIPVVAAFIWFALEIDKRNSQRDEQMQTFLREQRSEDREVLKRLVDRMDQHDSKVTAAILTMQERTRPREEVRKPDKQD